MDETGEIDWAAVAAYQPVGRSTEGRRAAVLAPFLERDGRARLLFTRRADYLGEHPGQMSFPGGGVEPIDADLEATARREANEEIGLDPTDAEIVGRLDEIVTVSNYVVTPFVARVPDQTYTPDDYEVAEVVTPAVADLIDPANYESERRDHPEYGRVRLDFFHVDGCTVWGATGRMLAQLLTVATDWTVPPEARVEGRPGTDRNEAVGAATGAEPVSDRVRDDADAYENEYDDGE